MQNKNNLQLVKTLFSLSFFLLLICSTSAAQEKKVELNEIKDSINLLIVTVKELEKENNPDKKKIDAARSRLSMLAIYNGDMQCGSWPPPSTKIELFEEYWKCTFDKALYGKKFVLSY